MMTNQGKFSSGGARVRRWGRVLALLTTLAVAACASEPSYRYGPNIAEASRHPGITCAPFARELSGVRLYGDADAWWYAAAGRYDRGSRPREGAVLVLRRTSRLPSGHVAVVSRVLAPRQVLVIQANWVHDELAQDQLAVDVSPYNDWTEVRMWWPPTNTLGIRTYPAYGFILPSRPIGHDALRRYALRAADQSLADIGR